MTAEAIFEKLSAHLGTSHDAVLGQMFGKRCIKVNGKAAVALFKESIVFKLSGDCHHKALSLDDSELWDPSGKGRPMKEWVQVSLAHQAEFIAFAESAANYVS